MAVESIVHKHIDIDGDGQADKAYRLAIESRDDLHFQIQREYSVETGVDMNAKFKLLSCRNVDDWSGQSVTGFAVIGVGDCLLSIYVGFASHSIKYTVFGPTHDTVVEADKSILVLFPPAAPAEDAHEVDFKFWRLGRQGPGYTTRRLVVPTFDEIKGNYHSPAQAQFDHLKSMATGPGSGKLMLWHGPPGTGKTYAVRALAQAWKPWCKAEYVIDPDALFGGGGSDYIVNILMNDNSANGYGSGPKSDEKWRLLILEDAGELIGSDAKSQTGQGFSRLLNLTDGLLGQGVKLMVLITTNEDLGKLAEAATRNGRCFMNVEVPELDSVEANVWRVAHGLPASDSRLPALLTDLYSTLAGAGPSKDSGSGRRKMGF